MRITLSPLKQNKRAAIDYSKEINIISAPSKDSNLEESILK